VEKEGAVAQTFRSAVSLTQLIRSRDLSAREVMLDHLERVNRINPTLNAIVAKLDDERCLALADEADRSLARGDDVGPLHGLPWAFKDLEDASVICLYLGDDLMSQLKPIFLKRLKPGTRIVSHRFKWEGWPADKVITHKDKNIWDEDDEFELHFWTVPEKGKIKDVGKKAKEDD